MSRRVLVVDSSRVIRTLLQIHLQQAGHGVLVCSGSQEALQLLRTMPEAPDLVFLGVHPSLKEDYEVVRSVSKSAHTHLIVMVLTEDKAHIQEALALVAAPLPGAAVCAATRPAEREESR